MWNIADCVEQMTAKSEQDNDEPAWNLLPGNTYYSSQNKGYHLTQAEVLCYKKDLLLRTRGIFASSHVCPSLLYVWPDFIGVEKPNQAADTFKLVLGNMHGLLLALAEHFEGH